MRKTYIKPETRTVMVSMSPLLTVSNGGVWAEGYDFEYGGVDENGEFVPASRRTGVWAEWEI